MGFLGVNWPGVAAAGSVVVRPVAPALIVPDITRLNWKAFKARGITGVVIDKDNCVTKPHSDALEPYLQPAWDSLTRTFGPSNVLVVSNSAGTAKDSLLLQAESVSRNLGVPVLAHLSPKPSKRCARSIVAYLCPPPSSKPSVLGKMLSPQRESVGAVVWPRKPDGRLVSTAAPKLLVIGDRLTTDVVLAHRLRQLSPPATSPSAPTPPASPQLSTSPDLQPSPLRIDAIPILTTTLHGREGLGTTAMRAMEMLIVRHRRPAAAIAEQKSWESCLLPEPRQPPSLTLVQKLNPLRLLPPMPVMWFNKPNPEPMTIAYVWQESFKLSGKTAVAVSRVTEWVGWQLRKWAVKNELGPRLKVVSRQLGTRLSVLVRQSGAHLVRSVKRLRQPPATPPVEPSTITAAPSLPKISPTLATAPPPVPTPPSPSQGLSSHSPA